MKTTRHRQVDNLWEINKKSNRNFINYCCSWLKQTVQYNINKQSAFIQFVNMMIIFTIFVSWQLGGIYMALYV